MAYICSGGGQNECFPKGAALCAAVTIAALALAIGGAWHPPAHADGGASARSQTATSAPDQTPATIHVYAQRILRALFDDDANNWVRYWRARSDCAAAARDGDGTRRDRALVALTAAICARLDALLGVNPAEHSPRGEERTVGLLINEPGAAVGYTLVTGYTNNDVFLIDPLGRIAHAWHMNSQFSHAKLLDSGSLLVKILSAIVEFDSRGNKIWEYNIGGLHHDFLQMPNGNVMMLVKGRKTREEAIAAGANPEFVDESGLDYDYLLEARPTSERGG